MSFAFDVFWCLLLLRIDVFCFLFLASFVRFAHLLILHTSTSSTYLPSTIFPSIFFLNPSSGSPFFPLLSISPLLRASRWQTDSWMSDGQNKETDVDNYLGAHSCVPHASLTRSLRTGALLMKLWDCPLDMITPAWR